MNKNTSQKSIHIERISGIPEGGLYLDFLHETPLERFGAQVRLLRSRAGYNPIQFAEKAGIKLEELLKIEFGFASTDEIFTYIRPVTKALTLRENTLWRFLGELLAEERKEEINK